MVLKKFFNLTINGESNEKGGSLIRLTSDHLGVNDRLIPCQMGLVEWDSKIPLWVWKELFKKDSLPVYPFDRDYESKPKLAIGDELMYMDGFVFNPYHIFDDISNNHHSIWNVYRNRNIVTSIEAGVMPVDGKDIVYVRRREFLGVLTDDGKSVYAYDTDEPSIRFIEKKYKSGELK